MRSIKHNRGHTLRRAMLCMALSAFLLSLSPPLAFAVTPAQVDLHGQVRCEVDGSAAIPPTGAFSFRVDSLSGNTQVQNLVYTNDAVGNIALGTYTFHKAGDYAVSIEKSLPLPIIPVTMAVLHSTFR